MSIQTQNVSDSAALQDLVIGTREIGLTKIEQKLNRSLTAIEQKWRSLREGSVVSMCARERTCVQWNIHPSVKHTWPACNSWNCADLFCYANDALMSPDMFPCYEADIFWPLSLNSDQYCEPSMFHYQGLLIHWWPKRNISQCNFSGEQPCYCAEAQPDESMAAFEAHY